MNGCWRCKLEVVELRQSCSLPATDDAWWVVGEWWELLELERGSWYGRKNVLTAPTFTYNTNTSTPASLSLLIFPRVFLNISPENNRILNHTVLSPDPEAVPSRRHIILTSVFPMSAGMKSPNQSTLDEVVTSIKPIRLYTLHWSSMSSPSCWIIKAPNVLLPAPVPMTR